jgi:hypothetical protein
MRAKLLPQKLDLSTRLSVRGSRSPRYVFTAIVCLLTFAIVFAAPVMLLHADCSHMATASCPHCHPAAASIQSIPLCCSVAQSTQLNLPSPLNNLESQPSASTCLQPLTQVASSTHPIYPPAASPHPPISRLILRI